VYFNAWGGSPEINSYVSWAGDALQKRFGISVNHVKLTDTAEAVSRLIAEKQAGVTSGGSIDLIWINGENFHALKQTKLLFGPFTDHLPAMAGVNPVDPTFQYDFTIPTDGLEAPWGLAQLIFYADINQLPTPPRSPAALLVHAKANPGRISYPAPPDFLGTSFVKQLMLLMVPDLALFQSPAPTDLAIAEQMTAPLWDYLDELHPNLWRGGESYPANGPAIRPLVADGVLDIGITFNPGDPGALVASGALPPSVRGFTFDGGGLANAHFLAIPANSDHTDAAMVTVNFLLTPEAQALKADPAVWGDPTVLDLTRLPAVDQALFTALPTAAANPAPEELRRRLAEPHPSWTRVIEAVWAHRFRI
jgi:putative thiamine transport system substrate-binding protein